MNSDVGFFPFFTHRPPLSGVIHAAGILDRCFLPELSAERLQKVRDDADGCRWVDGRFGRVLEDSHGIFGQNA